MLGCAIGFCSGVKSQTTYTWKTSNNDSNWANTNNWTSKPSGGTFPGDNGGTSDTVVINGGRVVVSGGSFSVAKIMMTPFGTNAELNIAKGATLSLVGNAAAPVTGFTVYPNATGTASIVINGTMSVTGKFSQGFYMGGIAGANIKINNAGLLDVGVTTTGGSAIQFGVAGNNYTIDNSGTMNIAAAGNAQAAMSANNGNVVFNNTGTINLSGTGRVGYGGPNGTFNNMGSLTTDMDFNCAGTFNNKTGGTLAFSALSSASTYNAMQATVVFNNQGGTLNTAPGAKNAIGLAGINTFTDGTLSPGGLSGFGSMVVSATAPVVSPVALNGILRLQVSGKVAGVDCDKISAASKQGLDIGGAILDVTGIYVPAKKDTVTILSAAGTGADTIKGRFTSVNGLAAGWSVAYSKTDVKLVFAGSLPVKLLGFRVFRANGSNRLVWETADETNNKGFYVQRRSAKSEWADIGFVGAKHVASSYGFDDRETLGKCAYRLAQVDGNGSVSYSQTVAAGMESPVKMNIFPNPAADRAQVSLADPLPAPARIGLYDVSGKKIMEKYITGNKAGLDLAGLPKGVYWIKAIVGNDSYVEKLTKH